MVLKVQDISIGEEMCTAFKGQWHWKFKIQGHCHPNSLLKRSDNQLMESKYSHHGLINAQGKNTTDILFHRIIRRLFCQDDNETSDNLRDYDAKEKYKLGSSIPHGN